MGAHHDDSRYISANGETGDRPRRVFRRSRRKSHPRARFTLAKPRSRVYLLPLEECVCSWRAAVMTVLGRTSLVAILLALALAAPAARADDILDDVKSRMKVEAERVEKEYKDGRLAAYKLVSRD